MTTKEKILEASRKLFNGKGLANVSVRDICAELGISVGNFSYHYPNKDTIIIELYRLMLTEMQEVLMNLPKDKASVLFFLESHKHIFHIQSKYKFFYLHLFEVLNNYSEITKIYLSNAELEKSMAKGLLDLYIKEGVLKKDLSLSHFERLINVGYILNNSWLIDAEVSFKGNEKKKMVHYLNLCCGLLEPYLTPGSLKEYNSYFKSLSK